MWGIERRELRDGDNAVEWPGLCLVAISVIASALLRCLINDLASYEDGFMLDLSLTSSVIRRLMISV